MTVVSNTTRGTVLASQAEIAHSAWSQFKGLMGRCGLHDNGGLVLPRTRGVHTHFMRFPIDVVFYDQRRVVVGVANALRPWRFSAYHRRAVGAIELPAGTLETSDTRLGDALTFSDREAAGIHA